jgi:hypothetical protein
MPTTVRLGTSAHPYAAGDMWHALPVCSTSICNGISSAVSRMLAVFRPHAACWMREQRVRTYLHQVENASL